MLVARNEHHGTDSVFTRTTMARGPSFGCKMMIELVLKRCNMSRCGQRAPSVGYR